MARVKLFTHLDLDGVGCAIVANHAFGAENVDVEYCDYKEVDKKVSDFFTDGGCEKYDKIFITDISVNEAVASLIDSFTNQCPSTDVKLIDHHATASWLNKYSWASVKTVNGYGTKTAGTSLLYGHLLSEGQLKPDYYNVMRFVEQVRRWDTWDWKNVYNDEHPKRMNSLLYLIGREKFVKRFTDDASIFFNETEELILEIEEAKIKNYIEKVSKNIIPIKIENYNVGAVYAEQYISELGNVLAEQNPQFDFIVLINVGGGGISYRGVKDDIDLGQVAKLFGGGGHSKAAGSSIRKELSNAFAQSLFRGDRE
jgi:oligoribonuclease NrnB/cAMP/cGMP phosphodiesterase (DHH superfamily)